MSTTKRSTARTKGLKLAARVATVGGFAVAALGLAEARAASASAGTAAPHAASANIAASNDDAPTLPMEGMVKAGRGGNCGCAPCWGPPAPPARGEA